MKLSIDNCSIPGRGLGSIAIEDGKIADISMDPRGGGTVTERIDAGGGTVLKGLIDTHCHPFGYGWVKRNVDLRGVSNITGLRLRVGARVRRTAPGDWVTGFGWDQEQMSENKMPNRADLDDISSSNPVVLSRICGHVAVLNTLAIEKLKLSTRHGDEYERDSQGSLTGIVKEGALHQAYASMPRSAETCASDLLAVEAEALRLGLVKMHCILTPEGYKEELEALKLLHAENSLSLRYRVFVPPEAIDYVGETRLREQLDDDWVRIGGVKIFSDGSLGARTAALREPYSDQPENSGLLTYSDQQLTDLVQRADDLGYQVIVHAIGDKAVEQTIEALSTVSGSGNPHRHRIEHAGLLPKDLRRKMAKLGLRATVQPGFVTSDTWASNRLGPERIRDLYPLRSMIEDGIVISGSSDSPIESLSPILGMWSAMVRDSNSMEQNLTLDESVGLYTSNAASNGFDDEAPGILEGSPADLTILDSNIAGMHPALFRKVGVSATVVGGALAQSRLETTS